MIRFAEETDRSSIRELFELCFPDDSGFNAYFFEHIFHISHTLIAGQEGRLYAMLQMLPYRLCIDGKEGKATYIYGACTHPEYRRQHWMARLLEASFALDRQQGRIASILIPQEDWLFDFYRPFGYEPVFTLKRHIALQDVCAEADIRKLANWRQAETLYRQATVGEACRVLRSESDWQAQLAMFEGLGAGAFGLYEADRLTAYAFVWREENGLLAQELIAEDGQHAQSLAQALLARLGGAQLTYCTVGKGQVLGCLKPYQTAPVSGYMNLMFN